VKGRIITFKHAKNGQKIEHGCGAGFGFIRGEDGVERFFHFNKVVDIPMEELQEDLEVEFEPYTEPGKGERARQVQAIR
jgi:cold shock CspA family protein